jgi:hypothetical protein
MWLSYYEKFPGAEYFSKTSQEIFCCYGTRMFVTDQQLSYITTAQALMLYFFHLRLCLPDNRLPSSIVRMLSATHSTLKLWTVCSVTKTLSLATALLITSTASNFYPVSVFSCLGYKAYVSFGFWCVKIQILRLLYCMECIIASFQIHLNKLVSITKPELYCDVVECDTHYILHYVWLFNDGTQLELWH